MGLEVNQLECLTDAGNTGVGSCYVDFQRMVGAFLAPKGFEIDVTDLQTNLIAACHAASKANRLFPIYDFVAPTDATEKPVIQKFPNGSSAFVRDGFNDWTFQFIKGGASLLKQLRKFNKTAYDFFFIDADGKLLGIDGSSPTMLRAFPSDGGYFMALPWKPNDGSKITEYLAQFVFDSKYTADQVAFAYDDSFDIQSTVLGLQNVVVSVVPEVVGVAAKATETIVIGATNDTIDTKVAGVSISGVVTQTGTETTTLMATKIAAAINTKTGMNGGFSATSALGVVTIIFPVSQGAAGNAVTPTATIVGTITATFTASSGGVTATGSGTSGTFDVTLKTEATKSNMFDSYETALSAGSLYVAANATTGNNIPVLTAVAGNATKKNFYVGLDKTSPNYVQGEAVLINLGLPATLQAAGIDGFESTGAASVIAN